MSLTTKVNVAKFSFLNEKSFNKTVIDFNFGRHKDLSTLQIGLELAIDPPPPRGNFVHNDFLKLHYIDTK